MVKRKKILSLKTPAIVQQTSQMFDTPCTLFCKLNKADNIAIYYSIDGTISSTIDYKFVAPEFIYDVTAPGGKCWIVTSTAEILYIEAAYESGGGGHAGVVAGAGIQVTAAGDMARVSVKYDNDTIKLNEYGRLCVSSVNIEQGPGAQVDTTLTGRRISVPRDTVNNDTVYNTSNQLTLNLENATDTGIRHTATGPKIDLSNYLRSSSDTISIKYTSASGNTGGLFINDATIGATSGPSFELSSTGQVLKSIKTSTGAHLYYNDKELLTEDAFDAITIKKDTTIGKFKVIASDGLKTTSNGVVLNYDDITVGLDSNDKVCIKVDPARAITTSTSGIGVNTDQSTTTITDNKVAVRLDTAGAIIVNTNGIAVNPGPGIKIDTNALTINTGKSTALTDNQLEVKPADSTLEVIATGVRVINAVKDFALSTTATATGPHTFDKTKYTSTGELIEKVQVPASRIQYTSTVPTVTDNDVASAMDTIIAESALLQITNFVASGSLVPGVPSAVTLSYATDCSYGLTPTVVLTVTDPNGVTETISGSTYSTTWVEGDYTFTCTATVTIGTKVKSTTKSTVLTAFYPSFLILSTSSTTPESAFTAIPHSTPAQVLDANGIVYTTTAATASSTNVWFCCPTTIVRRPNFYFDGDTQLQVVKAVESHTFTEYPTAIYRCVLLNKTTTEGSPCSVKTSASSGGSFYVAGKGIVLDSATNEFSAHIDDVDIKFNDDGALISGITYVGPLYKDTATAAVELLYDENTLDVDNAKLKVKIDANAPISTSTDGINISVDNGLLIDTNKIKPVVNAPIYVDGTNGIKLNLSDPFKVDTDKLALNYDDSLIIEDSKLGVHFHPDTLKLDGDLRVFLKDDSPITASVDGIDITYAAPIIKNSSNALTINTGNGITVTDDKLTAVTKPDTCLSVTADGITITTGAGLKTEDSTLKVDTDNKSIVIDTDNKVSAKVDTTKGMNVSDTDGIQVKVDDTSVSFDTDGKVKVNISPDTDNVLSLASNGIKVAIDGDSIKSTSGVLYCPSAILLREVTGTEIELKPNEYTIVNGTPSEITVTLATNTSNYLTSYAFEFTTPPVASPFTLHLPAYVKIADGLAVPTTPSTTYQCTIVRNILTYISALA